MAEPLNLENPTIINKPKRIQVSSSTFLFAISLVLLSFTFLCLSSKDTTFWFLLSNAIIFFVAADSNASSPSKSKSKSDIYDEYMKIARSRNMYSQHAYRASVSPSSLPTIPDGNKDTEAFEKHTSVNVDSGDKYSESETEKAIVAVENKENMPHELETGDDETNSNSFSPSKPKPHLCIEYLKEEQEKKEASDVQPSGNAMPGERYRRSESEKAIVAVEKQGRVLRRSETGNGGGEADNSDFSAMSIEELNRRFEEFIQRFNRGIRLEEVRQRSEEI